MKKNKIAARRKISIYSKKFAQNAYLAFLFRFIGISGDYLDINECFVEMPNFQPAPDPIAVETVEFKDDCLRACLRSQIRGRLCLSAEHRPKDNACVLSEKYGEKRSISVTIKKNSYFENICARSQEGGRLEAKLTGFRGGEGVLELVQCKGEKTKLLAIMTGLQENRDFHVIYIPGVELSSCHKIDPSKDNPGRKLITIDSDSRGMAIQPWIDVDFNIFDSSVINKTIAIVDSNSSNIVDCGYLQINMNASEWDRAKNGFALNCIYFGQIITISSFLSIFF
ncbi:PAN domain protein [Dictyocaulus viviparus]|uniref:PAN domain protein n=1 Tax=Dictyocaulus viviparus TaxID=29172 RepID=A0A0D8X9K2_DICVI|nr:PAN domain protein [Dictyocaulus viviparus]